MSSELLALSLFIHIVSTVLWIGGLFITVLLVWPEAQRVLDEAPTLTKLLSRWRKRWYPISNLSLVALVVTGLFQMTADPFYDGLLTFDNTWSQVMLAKHILIIAMAIAGIVIQYGVSPALERTSLLIARNKAGADTTQQWQRLRKREVRLTWLNGLLGLAVLFCSAWLTAL